MKPSAQYRIALLTGAGFAALVAGLATTAIAAMAWPGTVGWPTLAEPQAAVATAAYSKDPADLRGGEAAARRLVSVAPADGPAWLSIAYADLAADGRLGPDALKAIDHSYAVMPFDPDRASWRLRVLLEHWQDVPPALRRQALAELEAKGAKARPMVNEVRNPAGRLAAEMVVPQGRSRAR